MHDSCLLCGGELPEGRGESPFCPHCGTPQLFLALENQSVETGGEVAGPAGPSTGALPPPRPQQVDWKTAIGCAAMVAAIGAALTLLSIRVDLLKPMSILWFLFGSLITLGLYQKRRPEARMDVRVGARIGVVVGVCLALGIGFALAAVGVVARYGLHSMGSFDTQMTEQIGQLALKMQKTLKDSAQPEPAGMMNLIKSPEFRAGMILADFAIGSVILLALSTLGGAFAGLIRTRRTTP